MADNHRYNTPGDTLPLIGLFISVGVACARKQEISLAILIDEARMEEGETWNLSFPIWGGVSVCVCACEGRKRLEIWDLAILEIGISRTWNRFRCEVFPPLWDARQWFSKSSCSGTLMNFQHVFFVAPDVAASTENIHRECYVCTWAKSARLILLREENRALSWITSSLSASPSPSSSLPPPSSSSSLSSSSSSSSPPPSSSAAASST